MPSKSPLLLACLVLVLNLPVAESRELPDAWPNWLKKEMRKEKKRLRDKPIDVGEGLLTTRLPGKQQGDPEAFDGGWYFSTDIGSDTVMECWLMEESQDLAAFAVQVADLTVASSVEASGPESGRQVWAVDAGNFDSRPWIALEWLYAVGEEPDKRIGLAKVRTTDVGWTSLACSHNALGYRDTFERAFQTIVENAETAPVEMPPYYEEMFVVSIGGQKVGVISNRLALDEEGDTRSTLIESMLMPVDESTVSTSDSFAIAWTRPDGSMISASEATAENGTLTSQLSLAETEDGGWWVSGTVQGKEIDSAVVGDGEPMSDIQQMHIVRDLQASAESNAASLSVWIPEADPTRILPSEVSLDRERGDGHGYLQMGPVMMDAQFDKQGALLNASMQFGAAEMLINRTWTRGSPP